jgi:hypothetical protein
MPAFAGMTAQCYKRAMTNSMRIIGLAGWSGSGKTTLISC